MTILPDFIEELRGVTGEEGLKPFLAALERLPRTSVRLNPAKGGVVFSGKPVEWSPSGIILDERPSFTLDPLFHAGCYYVQESSSMFLEPLFKQIASDGKLRVLDMCADPGRKSTHLASMISPDTLLVANEVIRSRASVLKENIIKWGSGNTVVTYNDPHDFASLRGFFDIVLVDAPCSGEGMFRKNEAAMVEWSLKVVELCRQRQRRILADAWEALAPRGYLIYSTCTFNRRENEEQVAWMEEELEAEYIDLDLPLFGKVIKSERGFRFHPDRADGEGFFISAVRKGYSSSYRYPKKSKNLPAVPLKWLDGMAIDGSFIFDREHEKDIAALNEHLNVIYKGVELGEIIRGDLKPSHALAIWNDLPETAYPRVELPLDKALDYLRKKDINDPAFFEGYNIVTYHGQPLGFAKKIGNRVNNLYPKKSRIIHL